MNPSSSMVNSEVQPENEVQEEEEEEEDFDESSSEEIGAVDDDSDDDPTFDIREETCRSLSKLSLLIKKSKSRIPKVIHSDNQGEVNDDDDVLETIKVPMELDESDFKGFDHKLEKLIQGGQLEKLKVEECKLYLRKHGLRLTGNKDVLIQRIREHLEVINGGGEHKYPVSSFVLNCKGDACTGDIVMFEQTVYEMFSIASRSATGPPCGTRVIAGRIVKESYGAAKQQHTFTIEVLWSKGVKPLPPLHPLLIKGRNLYRLQTMRQRWDDEEKRRQVLLEKHSRGASARSNRETRIQVKEMRKTHRGQRGTGAAQEQRRQPRSDTLKTNIQSQTKQQPFVAPVMLNQCSTHFTQQKPAAPPNTVVTEICQQNVSRLQPNLIKPQNCNVIEQKTWVSENSNGAEHRRNSGFTTVENHRRNGFHPVVAYPSKDHRPHDGLHGGNHGGSDGSLHKQPSILGSPPRSPMHHLSRNDNGFNVQRCSNENGKFPQREPLTTLRSPPRSPLHRSPMHHLSRNDHGFNVQRCSNENGKFPHREPLTTLRSPPRSLLHRSPMHHLSRNDHGFNVQRCSNENGKFPQREPLTATLRSPPRSPLHRSPMHHLSRNDHGFNVQRCSNENGKSPQRQSLTTLSSPPRSPLHRSPMHHSSRNDHGFNVRKYSNENDKFPQRQPFLNSPPKSPLHRWGRPMERQVCRYYPLGRCHYGDNCKYVHENGDRREQRFPNNQRYYGYH